MHCRTLLAMLFLTSLSFFSNANTEKETDKAVLQIESPLYKPLVERYILDELKQLRQDQQATRAELIEKVVNAKLESSDRAIRYTADTTTPFFISLPLRLLFWFYSVGNLFATSKKVWKHQQHDALRS